jgi:hypothetical protein
MLSQAARAADGSLLLHLVRLDPASAPSPSCTLACERQPQQVLPLAPERNYAPVPFTFENGRVRFAPGDEMTQAGMPRYVLFHVTF